MPRRICVQLCFAAMLFIAMAKTEAVQGSVRSQLSRSDVFVDSAFNSSTKHMIVLGFIISFVLLLRAYRKSLKDIETLKMEISRLQEGPQAAKGKAVEQGEKAGEEVTKSLSRSKNTGCCENAPVHCPHSDSKSRSTPETSKRKSNFIAHTSVQANMVTAFSSAKFSKPCAQTTKPLIGSRNFMRPNIDFSSSKVRKILSSKFLTFYVGNLSYHATDSHIKKIVEKRLAIKVDQVVIAVSSDGRSRGCGFITVHWDQYVKKEKKHIVSHLVQEFCSKLSSSPICGRSVFIELAHSQRRGASPLSA